MEKEIITQKKLVVLANDAYLNAQRHGFYPDNTDITTALMLIITEMAEAVQADRHNSAYWYISKIIQKTLM